MTLDSAPLQPKYFFRYVDGTFLVWQHGAEKLNFFLQHLNSPHVNIKFTMEIEKDGTLPFLDVLIRKKYDGRQGHSVYHKPTHTDQYLHAGSFHHPTQIHPDPPRKMQSQWIQCGPGKEVFQTMEEK